MKLKSFYIYLVALIALLTISTKASTDLIVDLTHANIALEPATNRTIWIQRSSPYAGNLRTGITDSNGSYTFTNIYAGTLQIQVRTPPTSLIFYVLVTDTNQGAIQAGDNIVIPNASTFPVSQVAWATSVSDGRYSVNSNATIGGMLVGTVKTNSFSESGSNYIYSIATTYGGGGGNGVTTNDSRALSLTNTLNVFGASYIDTLDGGTPSYREGRMFYDTNQKTLAYYNDSPQVTLNVGAEEWVRVSNKSGSTITNGAVVYVNGAQGQLPTIGLAIATNFDKSTIIGMATMDITNNTIGYVTINGVVGGLNTSSFIDGDQLYLSITNNGSVTTNRPTAPNYAVMVGVVLYSHNNQGKILIHPDMQSTMAANVIDLTNAITSVGNTVAATMTNASNQITGTFAGNGQSLTLSSAVVTNGGSFTSGNYVFSQGIVNLLGNVLSDDGSQNIFGDGVTNKFVGIISGDGSGVTNLPAANLTGTIAAARLPTSATLFGTNVVTSVTASTNASVTVTTNSSGISITLNGLTTAQLQAMIGGLTNVALLNANQSFTGTNSFSRLINGIGIQNTNNAAGTIDLVQGSGWAINIGRTDNSSGAYIKGNVTIGTSAQPTYFYGNNQFISGFPFSPAVQGSAIGSDGTNFWIVFRNSAGAFSTNKATLSAYP